MQSYPQPPAQNMTPQRPWWLIYGACFGVGFGLIDVTLSIAFGSLNAFLDLLYLSVCLVAGLQVARKTRRAGSATLASLLVGLLLTLITVLFRAIPFSLTPLERYLFQRIAPLPFVLLLALLGIYVGFLGGLIGRTAESTRRIIGLFYAVGVILVLMAAIPLLGARSSSNSILVIIEISLTVLGSLCGTVAWIMTLVQYARAQSWGAFTLTLFFSGIMILVYLIAGAQPGQPASYVAQPPGAYVPIESAYPPMQPVPPGAYVPAANAYPSMPPQPDAVSLLQQRYARGEIDAEMYRQMLAVLTSSPANPPRQF